MDARLSHEPAAQRAEVEYRGRGSLEAAASQPPELTAQSEDDSFARDVFEHGRTRNHRREHGVCATVNSQPPREQQAADERNVPAYIIFSDASLREMARQQPTRLGDFGKEAAVLIRRHPLPAVLIGFGVGLLLGRAAKVI